MAFWQDQGLVLEAPCGPWHVAAADAMPFMGGGSVQRQLEFRVGARAEMLQKSAFASVFWHAACFSPRLPLVNFDVHDSGLQDAQKELTTAADETPKKKLRRRKKGGRTPVHKGSPGVRRKLEFETPKGRSSKASRASKARSQEGHIGSEEGNASGSEDEDVFRPFKRREGSSKPLL